VFGIGTLEIIFILIIVLLVIGPKDIEKTSRNLGKMINRVNRSPTFQIVRRTSEELRNLPARLAQEAQLEELKELTDMSDVKKELQETAKSIGELNRPFEAWTKDLKAGEAPPPAIKPPAIKPPAAATVPVIAPTDPSSAAPPAATTTPATTPATVPADPSSAAPPATPLPSSNGQE
jgi:Sec-independent protein translocase protein TatA